MSVSELSLGAAPLVALALGAMSEGCGEVSSDRVGATEPPDQPYADGPICPDRCKADGDCPQSMVCGGYGFCARKCRADEECGPAPEWRCFPDVLDPSGCLCSPTGPEDCDGRDNDCNGRIDDGARCPGVGEQCVEGKCVCPPSNACGGQCFERLLDVTRCGTCDNACTLAPAHAVPICANGECDFLCEDGWSSCDGDVKNGCETVGTCVPELISVFVSVFPAYSELPERATRLVTDAERAYWNEPGGETEWSGRVMAWMKSGGEPTAIAVGLPFVSGLSRTDDTLYWSVILAGPHSKAGSFLGSGTFYRWRGLEPELVLEQKLGAPIDLTTSDQTLVWSTEPKDLELGTWAGLYAWSGTLRLIADIGDWSYGLSTWNGYVYALLPDSIARYRLDCTSGFPHETSGEYQFGRGAVDASGAYWLLDHRLIRTDHNLVDRKEYAIDALAHPALALDPASVYVSSAYDLVEVAKSTGARHTLALGAGAIAISADETHVYWVARQPSDSHASVWRVRRR